MVKMMTTSPMSIYLANVPFYEQSGKKLRPAVVLAQADNSVLVFWFMLFSGECKKISKVANYNQIGGYLFNHRFSEFGLN